MNTPDKTTSSDSSELQEQAIHCFPKTCSCGRRYETFEEFVAATEPLGNSGEILSADGQKLTDIFRNCVCGSTLLVFIREHRDESPDGISRRKKYGERLKFLTEQGLTYAEARKVLDSNKA
jgi:hypothetical protein